ncbi:MAG: sodium:proton antiporter [Deltaproteobacteria bacterium]|nr:sodium:proton antiporter [Deltaproteobacteria bacterium]
MRTGVLLLLFSVVLLIIGISTGVPFFADKGTTKSHAESPGKGDPIDPSSSAADRGGEHEQAGGHDPQNRGGHGAARFVPPIPAVLPFIGILLIIAVFPLVPRISHWWENNRNRLLVSIILGVPVAIYIYFNDPHQVSHTALEYFQFLSLLAGLFITAGGIHVSGDLRATPLVNSLFLLVGYVLASVIGTTGAAMVLIYPVLRTNRERHFVAHTVIFFIFLVCNTGGLLSPIGDPPLFLGYLRGIDFFWFLKLTPLWILNGVLLFAIYYAIDAYYYAKETSYDVALDRAEVEPLRMIGGTNIVLLLSIVVSVALSVSTPFRECIMYASSGLSLIYSDKSAVARDARQKNQFNFHAILEVAAVFAGIFATMMPALILLRVRGAQLGVDHPVEFFYATGLFSSFLDNAPTFLVFLELGLGVTGLSHAAELQVGQAAAILGAISAGAVFMGANTYIGNAPNFMVRSISEAQGVKMPSFFGFMLWAIVILLPIFTLLAVLFFWVLSFPLF